MRLTVSAVAATRGSLGSRSAATAIFMEVPLAWLPAPPLPSDQEPGHQNEEDCEADDAPFHEADEPAVGPLVLGVVVPLRRRIFNSAVGGHYAILFGIPDRPKRLAESRKSGNGVGLFSRGQRHSDRA